MVSVGLLIWESYVPTGDQSQARLTPCPWNWSHQGQGMYRGGLSKLWISKPTLLQVSLSSLRLCPTLRPIYSVNCLMSLHCFTSSFDFIYFVFVKQTNKIQTLFKMIIARDEEAERGLLQ